MEEEGLQDRLAAFDAAAIVLDRHGGAAGGIEPAGVLKVLTRADICVI